jgi:hypothetical protein
MSGSRTNEEGIVGPLLALENKTVPSDSRPYNIVAGPDGWFVRTTNGESIGPFAALREIEDWLDARDQKTGKPNRAVD